MTSSNSVERWGGRGRERRSNADEVATMPSAGPKANGYDTAPMLQHAVRLCGPRASVLASEATYDAVAITVYLGNMYMVEDFLEPKKKKVIMYMLRDCRKFCVLHTPSVPVRAVRSVGSSHSNDTLRVFREFSWLGELRLLKRKAQRCVMHPWGIEPLLTAGYADDPMTRPGTPNPRFRSCLLPPSCVCPGHESGTSVLRAQTAWSAQAPLLSPSGAPPSVITQEMTIVVGLTSGRWRLFGRICALFELLVFAEITGMSFRLLILLDYSQNTLTLDSDG
ncbi:hypothetical protein DFH09DRAFT_1074882 [Mycena vulgaris]|nr:hypothetical protein DFH09DRAFT_1074882 [Mycena vulgaris]